MQYSPPLTAITYTMPYAGVSRRVAPIWCYDFGFINLIRWCVMDWGGLECFAESKHSCSSRIKASIIDWDAFSLLPPSEGDRAFKTAINSGWQGLSFAISWCDTRLIISLVGCDYHQKTKQYVAFWIRALDFILTLFPTFHLWCVTRSNPVLMDFPSFQLWGVHFTTGMLNLAWNFTWE